MPGSRMLAVSVAVALAVAVALSTTVVTAGKDEGGNEWPQFRGPAGRRRRRRSQPARQLEPDRKRRLADRRFPAPGWSSPIVWGDHIFLTAVVSDDGAEKPQPGLYSGGERPASTAPHRWMVYDIDFADRQGAMGARGPQGRARSDPSMSRTPTPPKRPITDGERVYVYFGGVGLFAFTMDGEPVWSEHRLADASRRDPGWGSAASPVLLRDRLVIVNDNDTQSYIAAYDTKTGKQVWRVDRNEGTNWATPFVWEHERGTEIVTVGTQAPCAPTIPTARSSGS